MHTLVVIPTFNEIESLPVTLPALRAAAPDVDVLIVDDNSPDGTGDWADDAAAADDHVHVLHRTEKNGLGGAYIAGFSWALERGYEVVCEMDADGSHRAKDFPQLLAAIDDGADLAIGSRWIFGGAVVNWPKNRHLLSRTANAYANVMLGLGVNDATAGFRAFRADVLRAIDLEGVESAGYCFQVDMTNRVHAAGFRIVEVPITFVERELGESKMDGDIIKEAIVRIAQWGVARRGAQVRRLLGRR